MNEQIKKFMEITIAEYSKNIKVDNYSNPVEYPPSNDYSNFTQIYHRFKIEYDFFDENKDISPQIHGLGSSIAMGEQEYFVNKILKNPRTTKESIKKDQLSPASLATWIGYNTVFMLPVDIFYKKFLKAPNWYSIINWRGSEIFYMGQYPIIEISQKIVEDIKNKIIVFDKDTILWRYVKLPNEILERNERLIISIEDTNDVEKILYVRTINDMFFVNPESIKIVEIID